MKQFILVFTDETFTETNGANLEEIKNLNGRDNKIPKKVSVKAYSKEISTKINAIISNFEQSNFDLEFDMRDYLLLSMKISMIQDKISHYAEIITAERCSEKALQKQLHSPLIKLLIRI